MERESQEALLAAFIIDQRGDVEERLGERGIAVPDSNDARLLDDEQAPRAVSRSRDRDRRVETTRNW